MMLTLSHFTTRVPKSLLQRSRFWWSGGLEGSGLSEGVFRCSTHRIFLLFSSTLDYKSSMQPVFSHCILPGIILHSVLLALLLVWVLKSPILYLCHTCRLSSQSVTICFVGLVFNEIWSWGIASALAVVSHLDRMMCEMCTSEICFQVWE